MTSWLDREPAIELRAVAQKLRAGPVVDDAAALHHHRARRDGKRELGMLLDDLKSWDGLVLDGVAGGVRFCLGALNAAPLLR